MQKSSMTFQGWLYPDKTVDASPEITTNRVDVLKPQYYTLNDDGTLTQITTGYNAYSAANVALVKQYSSQQFVTISGGTVGMDTLANNRDLKSAFLSTMIAFLQSSGFTGIELDFEGFGDWTPQQYADYKALVTVIGNAMHATKHKLMVDGPAISDNVYQGYYQFKYEDMNALPIDTIVTMAYDEQDDNGAGTPVSSLAWISNICQWMLSKITDHSKIVVGLPSYGYHGATGAYSVTKDTYEQSTQLPGFDTATRDASSGEMMWAEGTTSYDYSDSTTLQGKLAAVQSAEINAVSVWALPGNQWFPTQPSQPAPSPQPTPIPTTVTLTQDQIKAITNVFTPDQITAITDAIRG